MLVKDQDWSIGLNYGEKESFGKKMCFSISLLILKCQSNRSFKPFPPPPRATPRAFEFLEIFFQIPLSPGQKGDQMPPLPGKLLNNIQHKESQVSLAHG